MAIVVRRSRENMVRRQVSTRMDGTQLFGSFMPCTKARMVIPRNHTTNVTVALPIFRTSTGLSGCGPERTTVSGSQLGLVSNPIRCLKECVSKAARGERTCH